MKLYRIVVTISTKGIHGWYCTGLPAFYLDADLLGITSALHAERIAKNMILSINPDVGISIDAEEVL